MSKEAEIRVCKNKKCQKVLPAGYNHKYAITGGGERTISEHEPVSTFEAIVRMSEMCKTIVSKTLKNNFQQNS